MDKLECARPNCDKEVTWLKGTGEVNLSLFRSGANIVHVKERQAPLCAGCTNDLADWWLHGKKA